MGRFFSAVHINNSSENQVKLIKDFCGYMKKQGYDTCSEDDAGVSYLLAFSDSGKWATLTCGDYNGNEAKLREDASRIADNMKTSCFSVSVVDSDFAIIQLYDKTACTADLVVVGDASGYGFDEENSPKGSKELWKPLLTDGSSFEQLAEIWNEDNVFVEDTLQKSAALLGIDPENITSDYDDFNSSPEKEPCIFILYFKKSAKKSVMLLNTAFKKVFGEGLAPYGFVKIKGKQPYFVRVIGDEIIHVITYKSEWSIEQGYKAFQIYGGVATVYRKEMSLDLVPADNTQWLKRNYSFYYHYRTDSCNCDEQYAKSMSWFFYKSDDEKSLLDALRYSLKVTMDVMLPILDKADNLCSCVDYFEKYGPFMHLYSAEENFGNNKATNKYNEGLLYIKTNNRDDLIKRQEQEKEYELYRIKTHRSGLTEEQLENDYKEYDEDRKKRFALKNKLLDTPELYEKVMAELERRKEKNINVLRSYGLNL